MRRLVALPWSCLIVRRCGSRNTGPLVPEPGAIVTRNRDLRPCPTSPTTTDSGTHPLGELGHRERRRDETMIEIANTSATKALRRTAVRATRAPSVHNT